MENSDIVAIRRVFIMYPFHLGILAFLSTLILAVGHAGAVPIAATDLDTLILGAKIVGPVGPEVNTSLVDANGNSLGDLSGSVSCLRALELANRRAILPVRFIRMCTR
jgi:hypothetical protein